MAGVLDCGGADFVDGEEVFEAVGGVLQGVSADSKNEDDIRDICQQMFSTLKLVLEEASASQASNKKDTRIETSGKNKTYDIRIENFDVSYGERADGLESVKLTEVYAKLEEIEADKAPARASVILAGLGFSAKMQQQTTKYVSVTEPTNMLDVKAILWLENYLQTWQSTILVVSHDRNFLNAVATDIIHLHSQRLDTYRGDYENFVKTKEDRQKSQLREYEAQKQYRDHIQLDEVEFYYSPDRHIFKNLCVSADLESRICIGWTVGCSEERNLKIGYFSQHHVDQLDLNVNSVELLLNKFPGRTEEEYRHQLGGYGITGELAVRPVASLSGGQKSRVAFAQMTMPCPNFYILDEPTNHLDMETIEALAKALNKFKPHLLVVYFSPNFYILDEPTNHLDMETIEALAKALNKFKGGVVLVSHDERLIRMVCKELWVCENGTVRRIDGGFDEYREILQEQFRKEGYL
ncbi:UNVERIFIED_CONTAM: hypothetical protein FKN15_063191 [Acipenser sinensis]